jgi:hypothetical protein
MGLNNMKVETGKPEKDIPAPKDFRVIGPKNKIQKNLSEFAKPVRV